MRRVGTLAVVAAAAIGLSGCGKIAERAVEEALEGEGGGDVDIGEDGIEVVDSEGNVTQIGENAEVPEAFPDTVPVPESLNIEMSSSGESEGSQNWYVQGTSDASFDDLKALYDGTFGGNGWTIDSQSDTSSGDARNAFWTASREGLSASVAIFENSDDETCAVTLTVNEVPEAG